MKTKKGFTLVELLVVIAIIAMLLAILMPALGKVRMIAKRTVCSSQVKQIGVAMAAYASEYNDSMPWTGGISNGLPDFTKDETTLHPSLVYRTAHTGNDADFQNVRKQCSCGAMGKARPMRLAALFEAGLVGDAKIFYCPANTDLSRKYVSYTNQSSSMGGPSATWGRPHQVYSITQTSNPGWIRVGYDYYPIAKNAQTERAGPGLAAKYTCSKFSRLSPNYPYLSDVIGINDSTNSGSKDQVVHREGLWHDSNGNKDILVKAGINCLFNDGHVEFVKDKPVVSPLSGNTGTLFNNDVWDAYLTRNSAKEGKFFMYNMYTMISR